MEGLNTIDIRDTNKDRKDIFSAINSVCCLRCETKLGGVNEAVAARYTNGKTVRFINKEIRFKNISTGEVLTLEEFKQKGVIITRHNTEADKQYEEELKEKFLARNSNITILVGYASKSFSFFCNNPNESFEQLLERIKKVEPSLAKCDALFSKSGVLFSDCDLVLQRLKNNENITIGNKKGDEFSAEERKYQQELVALAKEKNSIAYLPTGTGKTLVAIKLRQEMAKSNSNIKVVFIVPTQILVDQQALEFQRNTSGVHITKISGAHTETWKGVFTRKDVIVCTPKALTNALNKREIGLEEIHLLIFDEAHHCGKRHPYKEVMDFYDSMLIKEKPLILGLTASPAGAITESATQDRISTLERNLQSKLILVKENIQNLRDYTADPSQKVLPLQLPVEDVQLQYRIENCMKRLEIEMQIHIYETRGTDKYEQELSRSYTGYPRTRDLLLLNELLANFLDIGIKESTRDIDGESLEEIRKLLGMNDRAFQDLRDGGGCTLKQQKLVNILLENLDTNNFRAIVFVNTRKTAEYLTQYIAKNPKLSFIKPQFLVGNNKSNDVRISEPKEEITAKFAKGVYNLLIATSVAEEGFNIPSCNIVIYYGNITSGRALIQARGRARDKNGKFYVIYYNNSKGETHYQNSKKKEYNMKLVLNKRLHYTDNNNTRMLPLI